MRVADCIKVDSKIYYEGCGVANVTPKENYIEIYENYWECCNPLSKHLVPFLFCLAFSPFLFFRYIKLEAFIIIIEKYNITLQNAGNFLHTFVLKLSCKITSQINKGIMSPTSLK